MKFYEPDRHPTNEVAIVRDGDTMWEADINFITAHPNLYKYIGSMRLNGSIVHSYKYIGEATM